MIGEQWFRRRVREHCIAECYELYRINNEKNAPFRSARIISRTTYRAYFYVLMFFFFFLIWALWRSKAVRSSKVWCMVRHARWADIVSRPDSIESISPSFASHFPRGLRSKIYFFFFLRVNTGRQWVFLLHSDYQKFIILLACHYALNNFIDRLTPTVSTNILVLITMVAASKLISNLMQQPPNYPNSLTFP